MQSNPIPAPNIDELLAAYRVVNDWKLHWYQVLYFHSPKLTTPGNVGSPFNVSLDSNSHCLKVTFLPNQAFNFVIRPNLPAECETQADYDAQIVDLCMQIKRAHEEKRRTKEYACCALAVQQNCVCLAHFNCALHGNSHVGTHD
jgi:hypothetical protein